jgi:MinD superfamily P-loop ATPase
MEACRFDAIKKITIDAKESFMVDSMSCEGCGVCGLVCHYDAVMFKPAVNGEWFISGTKYGPMSHARLGRAEENSGKLVSLIRNKKNELAAGFHLAKSISDGSPGTGCPVIASITGTDYALVVTEPAVSGVHDLKRVLEVIQFFKVKSGIIVNKYDLNTTKTEEIKNIALESGSDFPGTLPYDKSITRAQMKGIPVVEYTDNKLTDQIKTIWEKIRHTCFTDDK